MPTLAHAMRKKIAVLFFGLAILHAAGANALEPAQGPVVLTITGAISQANADQAAALDIELLESIGTVVFETSTIWTEGVQTFKGVELSALLKAVGASGSQLRASAINDYAVEIPTSDAVTGGPIVAFLRNGDPMGVRNKGPLWIVYPYDSSADYRTELVYSRSIWQLDRIEVLP